jgi:hypothetical protein
MFVLRFSSRPKFGILECLGLGVALSNISVGLDSYDKCISYCN